MQQILQQLGELFLQAVPTVVLLILFYFFLRAHLFRPLERVLEERHARTEGAFRAAEAAQAAAQEKEAAYQEAFRKARAGIYAEQEEARRKVLDERNEVIRAARARGQEEIRAAKERTAQELAAARAALEQQSDSLAADIARLILERPGPALRSPSEAR